MDSLGCDEIDLFKAGIEWAKVSCQNNGLDETNSESLKNQLRPCFYLIRFGAMNEKEIRKILKNKYLKACSREMNWPKL